MNERCIAQRETIFHFSLFLFCLAKAPRRLYSIRRENTFNNVGLASTIDIATYSSIRPFILDPKSDDGATQLLLTCLADGNTKGHGESVFFLAFRVLRFASCAVACLLACWRRALLTSAGYNRCTKTVSRRQSSRRCTHAG
jgi:hypothetical protein